MAATCLWQTALLPGGVAAALIVQCVEHFVEPTKGRRTCNPCDSLAAGGWACMIRPQTAHDQVRALEEASGLVHVIAICTSTGATPKVAPAAMCRGLVAQVMTFATVRHVVREHKWADAAHRCQRAAHGWMLHLQSLLPGSARDPSDWRSQSHSVGCLGDPSLLYVQQSHRVGGLGEPLLGCSLGAWRALCTVSLCTCLCMCFGNVLAAWLQSWHAPGDILCCCRCVCGLSSLLNRSLH